MSQAEPSSLFSPALADLGVPHFFSTRHAGDLATSHAADAFVQGFPPGGRHLHRARQVHGAGVVTVTGLPQDTVPDADGLVTRDPSCFVAIRTADCVPVLLSTRDGAVVAAVHAGWRGVVAGVVPAAIRAMQSLSHQPLIAAIGPCISAAAFEVGPEVVTEFHAAFGPSAGDLVAAGRADRSHVDLVRAITVQLRPSVEHVDASTAHCTLQRRNLFFSHRRDAAAAGRMLSGISPRGEVTTLRQRCS